MYKGFSICSHVIATAHVNGDLKSFLDNLNGVHVPNLSAIANRDMPSGTGRKGGVPKRKRNRKTLPIETRAIRPCLEVQQPSTSGLSSTPIVAPNLGGLLHTVTGDSGSSTTSTSLLYHQSDQTCHSMPNVHVSNPMMTSTGLALQSASMEPLASSAYYNPCVSNASTSHGPIVVGGNVVNFAAPNSGTSSVPSPSVTYTQAKNVKKPFVLKMKTKQIRICQSCRKDFDGPNDTMGLVVARAERKLLSNLATGVQFLGKESNSHYHLHLMCLKAADPSFKGGDLVISDEVKVQLTNLQRLYLVTCFQVC